MSDIKFLVGLGNPGSKYKNTRHNVGFRFIDYLFESKLVTDKDIWKSKFGAEYASVNFSSSKLHFIKPQTYMNCSGEPLQQIANFYKVSASELLVCYDDLDLPFGTLRLRENGSSGGHNGIKSIESCFGTSNFPRLRIGIGRPESRILENKGVSQQDVSSWVLSNFSSSEDLELDNIFIRAQDIVKIILEKGIKTAQLKGKF